jgi:two-component system response regulator AtoC
MNEELILIVDDEENMLEVLERVLTAAGYQVLPAAGADEALRLFNKRRPALVITDLVMPYTDGLGLLAALKEIDPSVPVVMITAFGTVETAVTAMKKGAYDYVLKPFDNDEILFVARKAISSGRDRNSKLYRTDPDNLLIGTSEKITRIYEVIDKVADSMGTVLIRGETGTGKELVAREIHRQSQRREGPFICVNCAALPDTLLESELFGYERGAFTGAVNSKPGRFEFARGGTIFLDEIGDMSMLMQAKLLRVLQDKTVTRLGGTKATEIDVRIIAATNKDIERACHEKEFRDDLYYRLNVLSIIIPPLREHKEDIPAVARYFVEYYSKRDGRSVKEISPECLNWLLAYDWPGNVRELENVIERAVILSSREMIEPPDLSIHSEERVNDSSLKSAVRSTTAEIEKQAIMKALADNKGNRSKAAKQLGISRRTLITKIQLYQIT